MIVSTQMSLPVCRRYEAAQMLVLVGKNSGTSAESTFTFFRDVVGYDLADFFKRNSPRLRKEFTDVLEGLLSP